MLIRRFELAGQDVLKKGEMPGFIHLYIGEEATAVGVCAHLRNDDWITSTHRGHGHALAKGVPPNDVMAELYAKVGGCCDGRGGSMHIYAKKYGLFGTNGFVGGGIPERGRPGPELADPRRRPGDGLLLRRRSGQSRRVSRIGEFRRRAESAGDLRLRKQPVRHGHAADDGHGQHRTSPRKAAAYGIPGVGGRRQRRRWPCGKRPAWRSSGPARAKARR